MGALVVGAGIVGGAIALELARRGVDVTVIERGPSAGCGSTSSSSAVVRFSYTTPTGVAMSWEGSHYWRRWDAQVGSFDESGLAAFRRCGMVVFDSEGSTTAGDIARLWSAVGVPHQWWDRDELARRLPYLDLGLYGPPARPDDPAFWADAHGAYCGALYCPEAGYVSDPQLAAHNLQRAAEAAGARFVFGTAVAYVAREGDHVTGVRMVDGSFHPATIVVNAAGPYSARLNRMAGVTSAVSTAALRQEVHLVPGPDGFDPDNNAILAADEDLGFYFRPDVGANVLLGGIEAACDPMDWVEPDEFDRTLDIDQWRTQTLRAARRMPGLGIPHQPRGLVDCYDVSDDWLPILDRSDLGGYYMAIGTSGNQFKNAPLIGHLMAELIVAVEAGHDHDRDPVEVTGVHTGCVIKLGEFSRNRSTGAARHSVLG